MRELILPPMSALRAWLGRLPRPVIDSLRFARTAALWLLEPLDRLRRRVTLIPDHGPVPPLWLRRHSGPISKIERAAAELSATIATLGLVHDDDTVLDIGCGCGSMALAFRRMLGPRGSYVGFDVHGPSIAWCKKHLAKDPRLRFELAPLDTPWSRGGTPTTQYRFPANDGSVDFVLAKSVFTHLLERDAQHYLREIRRVLKQGRSAMVTAFLLDTPEIAFPYGGPDVWWSIRSRPEAAVAYRRSHFLGMVPAAALHVEKTIDAFQDIIILTCATASEP